MYENILRLVVNNHFHLISHLTCIHGIHAQMFIYQLKNDNKDVNDKHYRKHMSNKHHHNDL